MYAILVTETNKQPVLYRDVDNKTHIIPFYFEALAFCNEMMTLFPECQYTPIELVISLPL